MCEPGKPCNDDALAGVKKAMEYLEANRDAIKAQFERSFASHPAIKTPNVQAVMKDRPSGTEKLKSLLEQFYLAGMMDLIVHGADTIDNEPVHEDPMEALSKLGTLIDALKDAHSLFGNGGSGGLHQSVQDFTSVDDLHLDTPPGSVMEEVHVVHRKTGKTVKIDARGKTKGQLREEIRKATDEVKTGA